MTWQYLRGKKVASPPPWKRSNIAVGNMSARPVRPMDSPCFSEPSSPALPSTPPLQRSAPAHDPAGDPDDSGHGAGGRRATHISRAAGLVQSHPALARHHLPSHPSASQLLACVRLSPHPRLSVHLPADALLRIR